MTTRPNVGAGLARDDAFKANDRLKCIKKARIARLCENAPCTG